MSQGRCQAVRPPIPDGEEGSPHLYPLLPGMTGAQQFVQSTLHCQPRKWSLNVFPLGKSSSGSCLCLVRLALTDEEVGVGRGGTILLLQELVEEGGEAGDDGGEGALSQDHEHEERVHEELKEDAGKPCKQTTIRGQAFMGHSRQGTGILATALPPPSRPRSCCPQGRV